MATSQKPIVAATPRKKRCRTSNSKRKRQRLKQLGLWHPVESSVQMHSAKRVKTSQQKCNGTDTENTQTKDTAPIKSPVAFTFGVDISENKICDNMQHVQAQVSFTFDSSDDSDFDTATACDISADDLWETFKSPMTFNLTCVATTIGVPVERQKSVTTPVKEANARWQAGLLAEECTPSKDFKTPQKVSFASGEAPVHEVEHWDRKGQWEEIGRDHVRFQRRVEDVQAAIGYIFTTEHRNKILANTMFRSSS